MESITSVLNNFQFVLKNREPRSKGNKLQALLTNKRPVRHKQRDSLVEELNHVVDVHFEDFSDVYNTKVFQDNFQRPAISDVKITTCVTLEDVKDVVLYTAVYDIPKDFIELFLTRQVDRILRSLILYMQFFLTMHRVVQKRREALVSNKIRHPTITAFREGLWKNTLSDLRFLVSRDYFSLIMGLNGTERFHHAVGSRSSRRNRDLNLYQLLHVFIKRVLEVVLMEKGNPVIEEELNRLFANGGPSAAAPGCLTQLDIDILGGGEITEPRLLSKGALSKEFFSSGRNPILQHIGEEPWLSQTGSTFYRAIEFILAGGESRYEDANVYLGVLGCDRSEFDCFLNLLPFMKIAPHREENLSQSGSQASENDDISGRRLKSIHQRDGHVSVNGPSGVLPKRVERFEYEFLADYLGRCENHDERHMAIRVRRWIDFRTAMSRLNYPPNNLKVIQGNEKCSTDIELTSTHSLMSKKTLKSASLPHPLGKQTPNLSVHHVAEVPEFFFSSADVPSDREDDLQASFYEGAFLELLQGRGEKHLRVRTKNSLLNIK